MDNQPSTFSTEQPSTSQGTTSDTSSKSQELKDNKSSKRFLKREPQPKVEPEYSEIDFTKYAEIYNEVMTNDFESSQRVTWNPSYPGPTGSAYTRTNPGVVPSPKGSDYTSDGVIVDIANMPLPSNRLEPYRPPPEIKTIPIPIINPVDSADLLIVKSRIEQPPTPLPTWVNREDWEEKKMRQKLRQELEELERRQSRFPTRVPLPTEFEKEVQRRKDKLDAWRRQHPTLKGSLFNPSQDAQQESQQESETETVNASAHSAQPHLHERRTSSKSHQRKVFHE